MKEILIAVLAGFFSLGAFSLDGNPMNRHKDPKGAKQVKKKSFKSPTVLLPRQTGQRTGGARGHFDGQGMTGQWTGGAGVILTVKI